MALAGGVTCATAGLSLDLDTAFNGTSPLSSNTPWLTADFTTVGNNVLFTLTATANLTGSENVSQFYFNFDDSLKVNWLHFSVASTTGSFSLPDVNLRKNSFKADGDGKYDIRLDFTTGGRLSRTFNAGDSISYLICYSGGAISEQDFDFLSFPDHGVGPFYAAAHVQNTGGGVCSGWIADGQPGVTPVPEPSTFATILLGGGVGLRSLRQRKCGLAPHKINI